MQNQTIVQLFHWFSPVCRDSWKSLQKKTQYLADLGVNMAWLPPPYKTSEGDDNPGYAVYDLYDLGEFDQKGSVNTKYGKKQDFIDLVTDMRSKGIKAIADIVLNHMLGGDETEQVPVREVDPENRQKYLSAVQTVEATTRFFFPGRNKAHSSFEWNWTCYSSFEMNGKIYQVQSEFTKDGWNEMPTEEKGSFDFLLGNDLEYRNPQVVQELFNWLKWFLNTTGIDGFRIDGVKHMSHHFTNQLLDKMIELTDENRIIISEFVSFNGPGLSRFLETVQFKTQLFDFALKKNLKDASEKADQFDFRKLEEGTLLQQHPEYAITFLDNHDTQFLRNTEAVVQDWFRPVGYAYVLLREKGIPVVFYPDLFGAKYEKNGEKADLQPVENLPELISARKTHAYGTQRDYFVNARTIGWTREGGENGGLAVILSYDTEGGIDMDLGQANAHRTMKSITGNGEDIKLNENGKARFPITASGTMQVWLAV